MPILTSYTDDWGTVHTDCVAIIKQIDLNFDAKTARVYVDVYGSETEYMDPDVPPRFEEEFVVQRNEVSMATQQAAVTMRNEIELVLQALAAPGSVKIATEIDYTTGTIDDTIDNTI